MEIIKVNTKFSATTHDMINLINSINWNEGIVLDFSDSFIRPFALLLLIATINKKINGPIKYIKSKNEFINKMDFYKYFENKYNMFCLDISSAKYSIFTLNINDFYSSNNIDYEKFKKTIIEISKYFDLNVYKYSLLSFFEYIFREILRNSIEHSYGRKVNVMYTYLKGSNLIELSIFDDSRGLEYSLSKNKKYRTFSSENVLDLVLEPGVSSYSNSKYINKSNIEWENSGYGLSIVKELCQLLKGTFIICSTNKGVIYDSYNNTKEYFDCDINGVGIQIRFHFGPNYDFEKAMKMVGEKLSLEKSSKASRILKL